MPPKRNLYPCLVCEKDVGGKTGSVQCNFCDKWVHPACGGISKPHLEILIENPSTTWTCKPCFGVSSKIKKEVQVLALKQDECRKEVQLNKEEIEKVKTRVNTVERRLEELNKDEIIKLSNDMVFKELRERESRKDNLVVHKVPELLGDNVTSRDRRDHDIKKVLEVFEFLNCVVPREDIKFIYRPGDKIVPEWPRPVILGLKDPRAKQYILSHSSNLANSIYSNISIVPDLTVQQRNEEEGLRKEAVKLNAELSEEESLNWEWVLVGLRGQKRLIKRRIVEGRGRGGVFRQQGGEARNRTSAPRVPFTEQRSETVRAAGTSRGGRGGSATIPHRGASASGGREASSRAKDSDRMSHTQSRPREIPVEPPRNLDKDRNTRVILESEEMPIRGEKEKVGRQTPNTHAWEVEESDEVTAVVDGVAVEQEVEEQEEEDEREDQRHQDKDIEDTSDGEGWTEEEGGGKKKGKRGRECSTSPSLPSQKKQSTANQKS